MDNFYYFKDQTAAAGKNGPFLLDESTSQNSETPCLLCEDTFNVKEGLPIFVRHLFEVHSIVIEEVQNIFYLTEYIQFWRSKFKCRAMEEIIPSVSFDSTDKKYYFLSSLIKDDKELRHQLRLNYLLKVQEFERTDEKYMKSCLYCKLEFEGKRQDFLTHLSTKHNLQLGNPHNLVFIEELIEIIEKKFNDLICLYCEKKFPERHTLKEHMRKKLHKRINHENKEYDKFFMVNYLEDGKDWHDIKKENDKFAVTVGEQANSDEEYSDWQEEEGQITCLFCQHKEIGINKHCEHMKTTHDFDFEESTKSFTFFQKIQLINYIRRQMVGHKCICCDAHFEGLEQLRRHMRDEDHFKIPDMEVFERSEFLFPTHEEDAFLYLVEDEDNDE
ncbi:zinc finger protein 277 isoform X2 [Coccinella septempunctata]|uniref:zinc finger protein 277 isoform X2 n=1 Tax=Coccinella septempunctata TaxID=41139 RepID=UPI001D05CCA2|nr:zinc finger protein 277 isoform X2 [Coccinella septempunctata]